jgi:phosphatidate cytidylyltransferase
MRAEAIINLTPDRQLWWLFGGVLGVLVLASINGAILARTVRDEAARDTITNMNRRILSWWVMCAIFGAATLTRGLGTLVFFALLSFLALREFVALTPARPSDHSGLVVSFFVVLPLQYCLLRLGQYGAFTILIPVFAFLLVPICSALEGDTQAFLERVAKIEWGLMLCVYCVSYAPALLTLQIPRYQGQTAKLLLFLVIVDQTSDVLQYVVGKLAGRRRVAPSVSPNKTWEGFLGGIGGATLIGAALWWVTPFAPWQAAALSLVIALMGFAGGLTMSAIKRDRGIKEYGTAIPGHGGVLDRIDSLCFAAPVFFHLTRYFFA